MIKMKLPLFLIFLISLGVIFTACENVNKVDQTMDREQTTMNKGEPAPMFVLNDLDGNKIALADLAGEKIYLKYWATWCSICLAGLEELNTLAAQENDFKVISIVSPGFNGEKSTDEFTNWFKKQSTDQITVLLDEDGIWAKRFGVVGYPTSYYIGSDSVLVQAIPGHSSNEIITSILSDIR